MVWDCAQQWRYSVVEGAWLALFWAREEQIQRFVFSCLALLLHDCESSEIWISQ
jgi:hypothetical protein